MNKTLTALEGVRVGHATHLDDLTGCTVVLFDGSYPTAYQGHGGEVCGFNTDSLRVGATRTRHGLFISGGSLTGLSSAGEIMQCMAKEGRGYPDGVTINPDISGAVVYDQGRRLRQYNPACGREAYLNLSSDPVSSGNVGAGTGTTVGKFQWLDGGHKSGGMKAGIGNALIELDKGIKVGVLTVVNAFGNVVLPDGTILAGNRDGSGGFKRFDETIQFVTSEDHANTTISIVGTNVDLGPRENYERVAHIATHGQIRAIHPVHTAHDGDAVFVFSTQRLSNIYNQYGQYFHKPSEAAFTVDLIGNLAAQAVQKSIYDACRQAETIRFAGAHQGIFPSAHDYIDQKVK